MYQSQKQHFSQPSASDFKWNHDKFDEIYNIPIKSTTSNPHFQKGQYQKYFRKNGQDAQLQNQTKPSYTIIKVYEQKSIPLPLKQEKQILQFKDLKKDNDDEWLSTVSTTFSEIMRTSVEDSSLLQVKFNLPNGIKIFKIQKFGDFAQIMYDIKTTLKLLDQQMLGLKLILLKKLYLDEQWKVNRQKINKPTKFIQLIKDELVITSKAFLFTQNEINGKNQCQQE